MKAHTQNIYLTYARISLAIHESQKHSIIKCSSAFLSHIKRCRWRPSRNSTRAPLSTWGPSIKPSFCSTIPVRGATLKATSYSKMAARFSHPIQQPRVAEMGKGEQNKKVSSLFELIASSSYIWHTQHLGTPYCKKGYLVNSPLVYFIKTLTGLCYYKKEWEN